MLSVLCLTNDLLSVLGLTNDLLSVIGKTDEVYNQGSGVGVFSGVGIGKDDPPSTPGFMRLEGGWGVTKT